MIIPNKYAKVCNRRGCDRRVGVGEGFAQLVGNGWITWCKDCCPERINKPAPMAPVYRKLTAQGEVYMPYEAYNLPLLRSFPSAYFEQSKKCWTVSLNQADRVRVLEIADQLKLEVDSSLRNITITEEAQAISHSGLYPFQVTGVNWLSKQDFALLGDEMGLGKSCQSLCSLPPKSRVLVVAPAGLKYNWRDEAQKWRPDYDVTVINGGANMRSPKINEILIVNYDILPDFLLEPTRQKGQTWQDHNKAVQAHYNILRSTNPELCECIVIADEIHKCKSLDAVRSEKIRTLTHICKRAWGLTGTPMLNKAMDLWGVLTNLNLANRAFGNALGEWAFANFRRAFNCTKQTIWAGKKNGHRDILVWGDPSPEVPEKLRRVMLQRKRAEVLPDLPDITYTDILISLEDLPGGSHIKKELDSLHDEWGTLMDIKEELPPFTQFSVIREKLARACVPAVLEYVENCEEQEVPLIVASAHLAPLDALLGRPGWACITGVTKPEDRQNIVHNQKQLKGLGCSMTAGGVGLNLQYQFSRILEVDLDWVPANNWQMEARVCRPGQTANKCQIIRFIVDHPLCRHIHKLLAKKIALIAAAIDAKVEVKITAADVLGDIIHKAGIETSESFEARLERAKQAELEYDKQQAAIQVAQARSIGKAKAKIVLEREQERARGTTRKILPLTPERSEAVRRAFKYMLSVCDGAVTRDFCGFSKPDAVVAHCILGSGLEEDVELLACFWMLTRYHRQLSEREPLLFMEVLPK